MTKIKEDLWKESNIKGVYASGIRSGTEEEQRVVSAVIKWLIIRAKERPSEYDAEWISGLDADAWHSTLLRRLLDGKEPLPFPPPIDASYPVYPEFVEDWDSLIYYYEKKIEENKDIEIIAAHYEIQLEHAQKMHEYWNTLEEEGKE